MVVFYGETFVSAAAEADMKREQKNGIDSMGTFRPASIASTRTVGGMRSRTGRTVGGKEW